MKINWKLRLKNKTTLLALLTTAVALAYQILGIIGIVPGIDESTIIECIGLAVNILALLGIVVDPTTQGVSDSDRAMDYTDPN